jgi:hypothetical protein
MTNAVSEARGKLEPGTRIEVRSRFDESWATGFEIAEAHSEGYRVKRLSDGATLPVEFGEEDVRPERHRKQGLWWY